MKQGGPVPRRRPTMLLADFHDADEVARWRPTDDVVIDRKSVV
jgi:hypothetical protein